MPRANAETVRAFYERWDQDDVPGFSELLAEDAEFASPPGAIDPGGLRGLQGFAAVRRGFGVSMRPWGLPAGRAPSA